MLPVICSSMGRKLNLGHLSEAECQHILEIVHKDFNIRFQEKERLREIEADVEAEETKYNVLSRSRVFNERNCICCFSRFLILINPRVLCDSCQFSVCKKCIEVDKETNKRICKACLKQRDLQKKSNDWFYSSVKKRFRRCGSAKVIRSLYKRRLVDDESCCESQMLVSQSDSQSLAQRWSHFNESIEDENLEAAAASQRYGAVQQKSLTLAVEGEGDCVASPSHLCRQSAGMEKQRKAGKSQDEKLRSFNDEYDEDIGFQSERTVTSKSNKGGVEELKMDSCIQTEREGLAEAGTMTMESDASRFFHCFDGMATVSTEGQELDPEFITRPHNIRVLEGESLHAECKVNGTEPLDVLWFCSRNQVQQLDEDDRCEISRLGNTFTLTIYDVRQDDTREFLCIAVNAIGQCAQGFTVTVDENAGAFLPPTFNSQSASIEIVPEGSIAVLRCSISAYPEPKVTWLRNNKPVMHGGRHRTERPVPGALKYSLVIESVRGDDSGCYVAVARNCAGETRHPVQLLIQPNPTESKEPGAVSDASHLSASSSTAVDSTMHMGSSEAELMRLAQDLSRTQGRYTTTATRMLRSADAMSSMQIQLDEMDRALQGLEGEVLYALSDDDDDDEDSLNNNNSWRSLTDEVDDVKSSAEAVGMVTSAALQLLSSAKEIAMETLSDSDGARKIQAVEQEQEEEEEEVVDEEEDDEEEEECVNADDLDMSYHELEKLFEIGLISRSQLKKRIIQKRNIKGIRSFVRQSASAASSRATTGPASGYQSEDSAMETSVDSLEAGIEATTRSRRKMMRREENRMTTSSISSSSSSGKRHSMEGYERDDVLKKESQMLKETEQQIYLTSGKVFSLEDSICDLERQVLEMDESTPAETIASLENSVARAVAQVTQSDTEVNAIERQVERWKGRSSSSDVRKCNDRFREEQHLPTETVVIATTPDAENNTTSVIG